MISLIFRLLLSWTLSFSMVLLPIQVSHAQVVAPHDYEVRIDPNEKDKGKNVHVVPKPQDQRLIERSREAYIASELEKQKGKPRRKQKSRKQLTKEFNDRYGIAPAPKTKGKGKRERERQRKLEAQKKIEALNLPIDYEKIAQQRLEEQRNHNRIMPGLLEKARIGQEFDYGVENTLTPRMIHQLNDEMRKELNLKPTELKGVYENPNFDQKSAADTLKKLSQGQGSGDKTTFRYYMTMENGLLYPVANQDLAQDVEMTDKMYRDYNPRNITVGGSITQAAQTFPTEVVKFYSILSGFMITKCYGGHSSFFHGLQASNHDPVCWDNLIGMFTSPAGHVGFLMFMVGAQLTNYAYEKPIRALFTRQTSQAILGGATWQSRAFRMIMGQVGMVVGMMASHITEDIAHNYKKIGACAEEMMHGKPSTMCDQAWEAFFGPEKKDSYWANGLSMISSGMASPLVTGMFNHVVSPLVKGTSKGIGLTKVLNEVGSGAKALADLKNANGELHFKRFHKVKNAIKAFSLKHPVWYRIGTLGFAGPGLVFSWVNLAAFIILEELYFREPVNDWYHSSIAYDRLSYIEGKFDDLIAKYEKSHWRSNPTVPSCPKHLDGFFSGCDDDEIEETDYGTLLQRFQQQHNYFRRMKILNEFQMARGAWTMKWGEFYANMESGKSFYEKVGAEVEKWVKYKDKHGDDRGFFRDNPFNGVYPSQPYQFVEIGRAPKLTIGQFKSLIRLYENLKKELDGAIEKEQYLKDLPEAPMSSGKIYTDVELANTETRIATLKGIVSRLREAFRSQGQFLSEGRFDFFQILNRYLDEEEAQFLKEKKEREDFQAKLEVLKMVGDQGNVEDVENILFVEPELTKRVVKRSLELVEPETLEELGLSEVINVTNVSWKSPGVDATFDAVPFTDEFAETIYDTIRLMRAFLMSHGKASDLGQHILTELGFPSEIISSEFSSVFDDLEYYLISMRESLEKDLEEKDLRVTNLYNEYNDIHAQKSGSFSFTMEEFDKVPDAKELMDAANDLRDQVKTINAFLSVGQKIYDNPEAVSRHTVELSELVGKIGELKIMPSEEIYVELVMSLGGREVSPVFKYDAILNEVQRGYEFEEKKATETADEEEMDLLTTMKAIPKEMNGYHFRNDTEYFMYSMVCGSEVNYLESRVTGGEKLEFKPPRMVESGIDCTKPDVVVEVNGQVDLSLSSWKYDKENVGGLPEVLFNMLEDHPELYEGGGSEMGIIYAEDLEPMAVKSTVVMIKSYQRMFKRLVLKEMSADVRNGQRPFKRAGFKDFFDWEWYEGDVQKIKGILEDLEHYFVKSPIQVNPVTFKPREKINEALKGISKGFTFNKYSRRNTRIQSETTRKLRKTIERLIGLRTMIVNDEADEEYQCKVPKDKIRSKFYFETREKLNLYRMKLKSGDIADLTTEDVLNLLKDLESFKDLIPNLNFLTDRIKDISAYEYEKGNVSEVHGSNTRKQVVEIMASEFTLIEEKLHHLQGGELPGQILSCETNGIEKLDAAISELRSMDPAYFAYYDEQKMKDMVRSNILEEDYIVEIAELLKHLDSVRKVTQRDYLKSKFGFDSVEELNSAIREPTKLKKRWSLDRVAQAKTYVDTSNVRYKFFKRGLLNSITPILATMKHSNEVILRELSANVSTTEELQDMYFEFEETMVDLRKRTDILKATAIDYIDRLANEAQFYKSYHDNDVQDASYHTNIVDKDYHGYLPDKKAAEIILAVKNVVSEVLKVARQSQVYYSPMRAKFISDKMVDLSEKMKEEKNKAAQEAL